MKLLKIASFCLLTSVLASCLKGDYDAPPDTSKVDPMLPVNMTLRDLSNIALDMIDGEMRVMGDTTVYGIVIGDDHSGNIYKQIIIQDSSGGGIAVVIDKTTLYGDYPIGRKIYIKLKGLILTNYNGLPELVYDYDSVTDKNNGIPSSIMGDYIIKASYPNHVEPTLVTMSDVYSNPRMYLNTLIKMENMQFDNSSANVPYSDPVRSTTRYISDCPYNGTLGMYNSSFANFQPAITPSGTGTIVGILSTYNKPQFLLRDTTDVQFTNPRSCP